MSTVAFGNIPPFYTSAPPANNTTTTTFTGGPWTFIRTHVDSSAETLATWRLDEDTSAKFDILNASATNAVFQTSLTGTATSTRAPLRMQGLITADTGSNPGMLFDVRTTGAAALATRPTYEWDNAGTVQAIISAGGVFKVGGNSATLYSRLGQKLETNTSAAYGGAALNTWSTSASEASVLDFNRSKSATIGTQTSVGNNDNLGNIIFRGSDGTGLIEACGISANVDGTPGTNDMPGRLLFLTTPDGSTTRTERMRITNAGDVGIGKTPTTGIILDVGGQLGLKSYTVATLPSAAVQAGAIVYASDAGGNGPCLVISNGTNWKRCDNTSTTVS